MILVLMVCFCFPFGVLYFFLTFFLSFGGLLFWKWWSLEMLEKAEEESKEGGFIEVCRFPTIADSAKPPAYSQTKIPIRQIDEH